MKTDEPPNNTEVNLRKQDSDKHENCQQKPEQKPQQKPQQKPEQKPSSGEEEKLYILKRRETEKNQNESQADLSNETPSNLLHQSETRSDLNHSKTRSRFNQSETKFDLLKQPESPSVTMGQVPHLDPVTPLDFQIRHASKEDNPSLKTMILETYTQENLLIPSLKFEFLTKGKLIKFGILGYTTFHFTLSYLSALASVLALALLRFAWTFLWIFMWPRLMISADNAYGGMVEKFRSPMTAPTDEAHVRRKSCLLVAEVKGEGVVGCLGVAPGESFINPTPTWFQRFAAGMLRLKPPTAEFKRLMVKESFRSRGVASRLLQEALAFCVAHDYESVTLSTFVVWDKARKLYAKFGFVESQLQLFDFSFHGKSLGR